jgi:hypothetical protein
MPFRLNGTLLRGYKRAWFEDAFARYVPSKPKPSTEQAQPRPKLK